MKENLFYNSNVLFSVKKIILAFLVWGLVFLISLLSIFMVFVLYPCTFLLDKERHSLHFVAILWANFIITAIPVWNFEIKGRENLPKKSKAVIYVVNHQSQADIIVIYALKTRFRWLAKHSLFLIPLFGWAMSLIGYVSVKRGSKFSQERSVVKCAQCLKNGTSVLFFPEGTRSIDGNLREFKMGAFRLALTLHVPIVPITLSGCTEMLPKGAIVPQKSKILIHIHPELSPVGKTPEELRDQARIAIESAL